MPVGGSPKGTGGGILKGAQLVLKSKGFWDNLPGRNVTFLHREFNAGLQAAAARTLVGQIAVPRNMVLDITSMRFAYMLATVNPGVYMAAPEGYGWISEGFQVAVNGHNPLDQFWQYAAVNLGNWGFKCVNRNVFESGGTLNMHLIVQEGSLFEVYHNIAGAAPNIPAPPAGSLVSATIEGRWMSAQFWNELREAIE